MKVNQNLMKFNENLTKFNEIIYQNFMKSNENHVEFYPPLRSGDKPKILAGSESMAGVFIMDLLPEDSAKILREHMNI